MTTKTDFYSIMELKENFKPKERGWIDQKEAAQVKNVLELDARTDIELQNIRTTRENDFLNKWRAELREEDDCL